MRFGIALIVLLGLIFAIIGIMYQESFNIIDTTFFKYLIGAGLLIISICIMFWWENKFRWWLRLPGINLVFFVILLVLGFIEEIYLTFHPNKRTKYINTSIYQVLFS